MRSAVASAGRGSLHRRRRRTTLRSLHYSDQQRMYSLDAHTCGRDRSAMLHIRPTAPFVGNAGFDHWRQLGLLCVLFEKSHMRP
jgi:hypothetical protein